MKAFLALALFAAVCLSTISAAATGKDFKLPAPAEECPKNGTTRSVGDVCEIDCDQCSLFWCELEADRPVSYYWRCQRDAEPDSPYDSWKGTWNLDRCSEGTLVDKRKNLAGGLDGGLCTHWEDLEEETRKEYKNPDVHPECQRAAPCEYGQDEVCSGNYWYRAPGGGDHEARSCLGALKWSPDHENCRPCDEVASCAGKC